MLDESHSKDGTSVLVSPTATAANIVHMSTTAANADSARVKRGAVLNGNIIISLQKDEPGA
jgi:hypothetical protein